MVKFGDSRLPVGFWSKVSVEPNGCWRWTGSKAKTGYSSYQFNRKSTTAHRAAYIALVGPIPGTFPTGLTVDHLCRNRLCVNPAHMELVSPKENTLRGVGPTARNKNKTHCVRGHELTDENVWFYKGRHCRPCIKIRRAEFNGRHRTRITCQQRERRQREREQRNANEDTT